MVYHLHALGTAALLCHCADDIEMEERRNSAFSRANAAVQTFGVVRIRICGRVFS